MPEVLANEILKPRTGSAFSLTASPLFYARWCKFILLTLTGKKKVIDSPHITPVVKPPSPPHRHSKGPSAHRCWPHKVTHSHTSQCTHPTHSSLHGTAKPVMYKWTPLGPQHEISAL